MIRFAVSETYDPSIALGLKHRFNCDLRPVVLKCYSADSSLKSFQWDVKSQIARRSNENSYCPSLVSRHNPDLGVTGTYL